MDKKSLQIMIIDDHKLVRDGVRFMLGSFKKSFSVQALEADSGEEALRLVEANNFDLVMVDYELPGISGAETVTRILRFKPDQKILAVSHHIELACIQKMMDAGTRGYVSKNIEPAEMLKAIRTVIGGRTYFSNEISLKIIESKMEPAIPLNTKPGLFTSRELEILQLLADEYTNEEIAAILFVSKRTIDTHRQNMINKAHVKNAIGLVVAGFRKGLLK